MYKALLPVLACNLFPCDEVGRLAKAIVQLPIKHTSRRQLLRAIAGAAAAGAVGATPAFAKGKRSKADVEYQDMPHGVERCEICAPFLPPDQCRTVVGPVSRQGWCTIYEGV